MKISREAYEALRRTYSDVMTSHGMALDPDGWPERKENNRINEYIYFNEIGFLTIFKLCRRGNYSNGEYTFNFRARLPEEVIDDMTNRINEMFPESNPLTSGKRIAREIRRKNLVNILAGHSEDNDEAVNMLINKMLYRDSECSYIQAHFIDTSGREVKKQAIKIPDEAFGELTEFLKKKGKVEQYVFDLKNSPKLLKSIINIPKDVTPEELAIIDHLIESQKRRK